ncbi:MAG: glycosyl hydrolase-related protein [Verrucomicrobiales bacterium]|nr:glycosyl hydrolase-related protein [Verrucomicrobiales bacterium]
MTPHNSAPVQRQKCFLVCQAHIDPVWLWPWEEGLTEAISTFRVAADFCDEYPDFVFNHNESLLYEWVERHDPPLFKRIQDLVKRGRWHIAGGGYLQPDMIGAAGESLIRHFLVGKTYFREKFNAEPRVAYNFDSFGHPQGLVQILAGCGFDGYVFCRPNRAVLPLPVGAFRWRHASGAEVLARRSDEHYITQGHLLRKMSDTDWAKFFAAEGDFMFLWGIGNHGGGPSRKEYADLRKLPRKFPRLEFIESDPDTFFRHTVSARGRENLPVVSDLDFKPVQEGCYTSLATVKRRHRRVENLLQLVESLSAVAWWQGRQEYPAADLAVAWKDLLFSEFHDILPGSCIPSAEADSLNLLGHAEEILRRRRASALIALLRDEPLAERNETPIFVFNPHSWPVTQDVEVEYGLDQQYAPDSVERWLTVNGKKIPAQFEKAEENLLQKDWGEWRARAVFPLTVPPLSRVRLQTHYRVLPPEKTVRWRAPALPKRGRYRLNVGGGWQAGINVRTGLLDSMWHSGREVLGRGSCQPQIFQDLNHSWATLTEWDRPVARFTLATPERTAQIIGSAYTHKMFPKGKPPVRIIEDGPVRTVIEAVFVSGHSYLVQRYALHKLRPLIQIDQTIFWAEHDRKLRLALNVNPGLSRVEAEKCYSIDDETATVSDGKEHDFQHFLCLSGQGQALPLTVVSHGTHAYSFRPGLLRLNLLRSPSYSTHEQHLPADCDRYLDRYQPRQEQGLSHARFSLLFGPLTGNRAWSARAAAELNVPLEPFVYFPTQRQPKVRPRSFATVTPASVQLTALKKAERGDDLVLRLWETAGRNTKGTLTVEGKKYPFTIGAHCLQTLRLNRAGQLTVTDLLERQLH